MYDYDRSINDCQDCWMYDTEKQICTNPGAEYMEHMEPDDGCTLWEED